MSQLQAPSVDDLIPPKLTEMIRHVVLQYGTITVLASDDGLGEKQGSVIGRSSGVRFWRCVGGGRLARCGFRKKRIGSGIEYRYRIEMDLPRSAASSSFIRCSSSRNRRGTTFGSSSSPEGRGGLEGFMISFTE